MQLFKEKLETGVLLALTYNLGNFASPVAAALFAAALFRDTVRVADRFSEAGTAALVLIAAGVSALFPCVWVSRAGVPEFCAPALPAPVAAGEQFPSEPAARA